MTRCFMLRPGWILLVSLCGTTACGDDADRYDVDRCIDDCESSGVQQAIAAFNWGTSTPEAEGMSSSKLNAVWTSLQPRQTSALVVIRNDKIVFERYAAGASRTTKHYTASTAKALVAG